MTRAPALVAASHGTSSPDGRAAVAALVDAVRRRRRSWSSRTRSSTCSSPTWHPCSTRSAPSTRRSSCRCCCPPATTCTSTWPTRSPARARPRARAALGPDDRLVDVLVRRLREVGLRIDDRVVLAAAGSSDVARSTTAASSVDARRAPRRAGGGRASCRPRARASPTPSPARVPRTRCRGWSSRATCSRPGTSTTSRRPSAPSRPRRCWCRMPRRRPRSSTSCSTATRRRSPQPRCVSTIGSPSVTAIVCSECDRATRRHCAASSRRGP